MENKQIKIIIKKPYQEAYVDEIDNSFDSFKKIIGAQTVEFATAPFDKTIEMLLDEDGKYKTLAGNFMVPEFRDCIVGTCIFASYDNKGEVQSLSEKQIAKTLKYIKDFELKNGEDIYTQHDYLDAKAFRKLLKNHEEDGGME